MSTLRRHWPEYLMEAAELGAFMMSACLFAALLEHPASPLRQAIVDPLVRRLLMGMAMGTTAISIVYSPWGKQSGAHLNPSLTLTFLRLGKVAPTDAIFYVAAQFAGGVAGVAVMTVLLGPWLADPGVHYATTRPGMYGVPIAWGAELVISFVMMLAVLTVSNTTRLARVTGLVSGALVATYITIEAPLSGMSMNPARSFGSAFSAQMWTALWIYFTAPPLGMFLAAELYTRLERAPAVRCAKLHHQNDRRCIFRCGYGSATG